MTGIGNAPAVTHALDSSLAGEPRERFANALVADAKLGAQLGSRDRVACTRERGEHGLVERKVVTSVVVGRGLVVRCRSEGQVDVVVFSRECERERVRRGCAAMLDCEEQLATMATHVQERVGPREEVARASQALTRLASDAILAGMVDNEHRDVVRALDPPR